MKKNKRRNPSTARKSSPRKPTPKAKKRTGITRYSIDYAILICERIATTVQPLTRICQATDMPGVATLFRWLREYPDFREMYCEARQMQAELFLEDALEIVDDDSRDLIIMADGRTLFNRAALQRSKMRVEYRKWIATKLLPRRYGNSLREEEKTKPHARSSSPPPPVNPEDLIDDEDPIMTEEYRMQIIETRRQIMENLPEDFQCAQCRALSAQSSGP